MEKIEKVELRNLKLSDYRELKNSMLEAYNNLEGMYWREHQIKTLIKKFPEGQICIVVNGKVVGSALSIIIDYSK